MSDPSARLIDDAHPVAEALAIEAYCRKRRGTFIVLRITRKGFKLHRACTLVRARISLKDKEYDHGSWLIAERLSDGKWQVREAHLTWFEPVAIEQLAQTVGDAWFRCYIRHPAMAEPIAS